MSSLLLSAQYPLGSSGICPVGSSTHVGLASLQPPPLPTQVQVHTCSSRVRGEDRVRLKLRILLGPHSSSTNGGYETEKVRLWCGWMGRRKEERKKERESARGYEQQGRGRVEEESEGGCVYYYHHYDYYREDNIGCADGAEGRKC